MNARNTFNGERLKKARIYRGLSVAELADKIECQRQTVSMYENSNSRPIDDTVIERMSRVLGFPFKFFVEEDIPSKIGSTYFRALLTTSKKYRSEQVQKMEFVAELYSFLLEYIEFPPLDLPEFSGYQTPENAALLLREYWGLGIRPVENIVYEVEQHGILVTCFETSTDSIDAFSQMVSVDGQNIFLIGYSNNKTSAARIHFDIAHELGHICLHEWSQDVEMLPKDEFKLREAEANRFAAAFLLPEESYRHDASSNPTVIPFYTQLKRKWKVSMSAMMRRSFSLGLITSEEYQYLMRTMQRRGLRKEEPLDDVLLTATPALLKTSVLMLLEEKVFTPKELVDELSFSRNLSLTSREIEYLLDLPVGTLTTAKILNFPDLRLKT